MTGFRQGGMLRFLGLVGAAKPLVGQARWRDLAMTAVDSIEAVLSPQQRTALALSATGLSTAEVATLKQ